MSIDLCNSIQIIIFGRLCYFPNYFTVFVYVDIYFVIVCDLFEWYESVKALCTFVYICTERLLFIFFILVELLTITVKEKFEDIKTVIRSCKSIKDRQYSDQQKKDQQ